MGGGGTHGGIQYLEVKLPHFQSNQKLTFVGQNPVVVSPGELLLDEAAGSQRLAGLDDEQVRDGGNVWVHASLSSLANFFSDHDSLAEEVLVDSIALLLGHKHLGRFIR